MNFDDSLNFGVDDPKYRRSIENDRCGCRFICVTNGDSEDGDGDELHVDEHLEAEKILRIFTLAETNKKRCVLLRNSKFLDVSFIILEIIFSSRSKLKCLFGPLSLL